MTTNTLKYIAITLVFFMNACADSQAISPTDQGFADIGSAAYQSVEQQLTSIAYEYDLEMIKPSAPVLLPNRSAFLLILKEKDAENPFYCVTIDNIKNANKLEYKFFKKGCDSAAKYEDIRKAVNAALEEISQIKQ